MRGHVVLALIIAVAWSSVSMSDEPTSTVAPLPGEPYGPQLPAASEESVRGIRLASAIEPRVAVSDQPLLQQKLAELDRLQAEIDALRKKADMPAMVMVNVQVLEVSRTKMRKLGVDYSDVGLTQTMNANSIGEPAVIRGEGFAEFVRALLENNIAKVVAHPSVAMVPGEPASFFAGTQVPLPAAPGSDAAVEYVKAGVELEAQAKCLGGGRVRLDLRPSISSMSGSREICGGVAAPVRHVWQLNTSCEMAFGETCLIPGATQERIEAHKHADGQVEEVANEIATWVVIRAEHATTSAGQTSRIASPYSAPDAVAR